MGCFFWEGGKGSLVNENTQQENNLEHQVAFKEQGAFAKSLSLPILPCQKEDL